jgi:hypothetical protein
MYKISTFIAFLACVVWAIAKPGYDSIIAAIVGLAAFIGAFYASSSAKPVTQNQTVHSGGVGIQAGGNVEVGDIQSNKRK